MMDQVKHSTNLSIHRERTSLFWLETTKFITTGLQPNISLQKNDDPLPTSRNCSIKQQSLPEKTLRPVNTGQPFIPWVSARCSISEKVRETMTFQRKIGGGKQRSWQNKQREPGSLQRRKKKEKNILLCYLLQTESMFCEGGVQRTFFPINCIAHAVNNLHHVTTALSDI